MVEALENPKYEMLNGKEYMMSPASTSHNRIAGNMHFLLYRYLLGKRCEVFYETMVHFDEENDFIPDLMIVCDKDKIKPNHIEGAPDLVIEVLSLSTRKYDRGIKKDIYEKFGVLEYWIVNPIDKSIEVYHLNSGRFVLDNIYHNYGKEEWDMLTDWQRASEKLTFKVSLYDDFEIDVRDVFR